MKITLKKYKEEPKMIEAFCGEDNHQYLAFVMHEDCVNDDVINAALADTDEIEVEISLVSE